MTEERIKKALELAVRYGGIDGAHHKDWAIDQMVRALTGCPMVQESAVDCRGTPYTYERQAESDEYKEFVRQAKAGVDGPETYTWEEGIPP